MLTAALARTDAPRRSGRWVDGQTVVYRIDHVWPRAVHEAEDVRLLVGAGQHSPAVVHWPATSNELDGIVRGQLEITLRDPSDLEGYLPALGE